MSLVWRTQRTTVYHFDRVKCSPESFTTILAKSSADKNLRARSRIPEPPWNVHSPNKLLAIGDRAESQAIDHTSSYWNGIGAFIQHFNCSNVIGMRRANKYMQFYRSKIIYVRRRLNEI